MSKIKSILIQLNESAVDGVMKPVIITEPNAVNPYVVMGMLEVAKSILMDGIKNAAERRIDDHLYPKNPESNA